MPVLIFYRHFQLCSSDIHPRIESITARRVSPETFATTALKGRWSCLMQFPLEEQQWSRNATELCSRVNVAKVDVLGLVLADEQTLWIFPFRLKAIALPHGAAYLVRISPGQAIIDFSNAIAAQYAPHYG